MKGITSGGKPGTQGVTASPVVGMAGEQAIMEAPFMKPKRRDFQGYPRAQIERMYNQAVEELQQETVKKSAYDVGNREGVLQKFAGALSELSGMSQSKIRSDVIREKLPTGSSGKKKFADYFELNYTDEFSKKVEENTSTTRMMQASEKMGLSLENVFKQGSRMLGEDDRPTPGKKRKMAGLMRDQLSSEIEKLQQVGEEDALGDIDLHGGGPKREKQRRQIQDTIGKLRDQKKQLDELYQNPKGKSISDLDGGSLFDFFVDSETGSISTAFRVLATTFHMQNPATGGTSLGQEFESGAGRATLSKRSSLLTSALVGHSASSTIGGLGGQEKAAQQVFQGWLSSKSGASVFANERFSKEVVSALQSRQGIDYKDVFDPDRVQIDDEGNKFYKKKNGDRVPLEKYVRQQFDWDAQSGELKVNVDSQSGGTQKTLQINPFSTLRETMRKQAGVVGMVTGELQGTEKVAGMPMGSDGRTLTLTFQGDTDIQENRISAKDFHLLFGKRTRAQQYHQHTGLEEPTPQQQQAYRDSSVYFGHNARPITSAETGDGGTLSKGVNYRNTIFNEQFDFLEVDLFGGLDKDQTQNMIQVLKSSGVDEDELARGLMGGTGVASAFDDALEDQDLQGKAELKRVVDYLRSSMETGSPSIYVPTKTGAERARIDNAEGGTKSANVRQWANLADRLDPQTSMDSISHVQDAVQSIHEMAQKVQRGEESEKALRETFRRELNDTVDSGAFQEVRELFTSSLRQASLGLVKQMEEMQGRYLGGEYKISGTQVDTLFDRFNNLLPKTKRGEDGPSEAFKKEVRGWMEQQRPDLAASKTDEFNRQVNQAAGDLHAYMQNQMDMLERQGVGGPTSADNLHRWRGFGIGEGFIGRSKAQKALSSLEMSHKAHESTANKVGPPTSQTARAKDRLRQAVGEEISITEASKQELDLVKQEVKKPKNAARGEGPGSTSGVLMITNRQPDFQVRGGYEASRLNVMGDEAMKAMGADPNQLHFFSHPMVSWSRQEDYDYDLNYMAAVDNTVAAHSMRHTRANNMPDHMVNVFQLLEDVKRSTMEELGKQDLGARELNMDSFRREKDSFEVGGRTVEANRVTTPMDRGEDSFGKSVTQFFGAEGLALEARAGKDAARRGYALQKSIVGQFGAYAKQGAIKTKQRNNAFVDTMSRLVKERDRLAEEMGAPGEKSTKQANRVFSKMFQRDLPDVHKKGEIGRGWMKMQETFKRVEEMRKKGDRAVFDELHKTALTEAEITEAVAIEKYKSGDPQEVSRRMHNIMQALHGNHRGGYEDFDSAWSALQKNEEHMPFPVHRLFGDKEMSTSRRRDLAKQAFKAQHDMNRAMKMAKAAGVGDDYMRSFANVPAGDVAPDQQLAMASRAAEKKLGGEALQTYASHAASRSFRSGEMTRNMRQFFATESYREQHLNQVLDEPATTVESFGETLRNLPTGAKAAGLATAAAVAVSAVAPSPNDRRPSMGSEQYDLPQDRQPRMRVGKVGGVVCWATWRSRCSATRKLRRQSHVRPACRSLWRNSAPGNCFCYCKLRKTHARSAFSGVRIAQLYT